MKTYQDFERAKAEFRVTDFIAQAINEYRESDIFKIATTADQYEAQRNTTIMSYVKYLYGMDGKRVVDFTSANNRIASNFFHRLTTQRVAYSLGNGVSFANAQRDERTGELTDPTKEALGSKFDTVFSKAGKYALIHGCSYVFWNLDHAVLFKMTEFCPLYDEDDGTLRAGFRFWSLDWNKKPVTVVVYEEDGYEKYRTREGSVGLDLVKYAEKTAYKLKVAHSEADGDEVIDGTNYSALPIKPFWGSEHKQSDLVGMRAAIDAYDLIKSGFANDLQECSEIYWIVSNAMGMSPADLAEFRDRLKLQHIAVVDTTNTPVTPYTQEIPVQARETLLTMLKDQIYNDYGALDVSSLSNGDSKTATEIEAAYQPMDEEADAFEYQAIECIQSILALIGIDDVPLFNRNRVSNQKERTEMVMLAANELDDETLLKKLPFITPDEIPTILARRGAAELETVTTEE